MTHLLHVNASARGDASRSLELAARFKVSQGTVRKAIDELAAENLVVRRQGKGTFVATHHEARAQYRFLRLMPDTGEPHHADNRILEVKRLRAPAEVARLQVAQVLGHVDLLCNDGRAGELVEDGLVHFAAP